MPEWLTIFSTVIGILGTLFGAIGLTAYIQTRMKHKAEKKNKLEDEREEEIARLQHDKYLNELRIIIKEENAQSVAPLENQIGTLDEKITTIDGRLAKVEDGTQDTLRDRILSAYYKCQEKGFHTRYDFENVHHMYRDYLALDGNSFVEDCMKKFDLLPGEEEYIKSSKKKKSFRTTKKKGSQILLENN